MKTCLLAPQGDVETGSTLPWNETAVIADLHLSAVFDAMAAGDAFVLGVVRKMVLSSLQHLPTILYRQDVLKDVLQMPATVMSMYNLLSTTLEALRKSFWGYSLSGRTSSPSVFGSVELLEGFVPTLETLRTVAERDAAGFSSEGFTGLFAMLRRELDDEFIGTVRRHLKALRFRHGILISARLGQGNRGEDYVLRHIPDQDEGWFQRLMAKKPPGYSFAIDPQDEYGAKALGDLRDQGIVHVARALARSTDHVLGFLSSLRTELAFYVGCLNLHRVVVARGGRVCFPSPVAATARQHQCRGLYDVGLTLRNGRVDKDPLADSVDSPSGVVGNDLDATDKNLVIITGANQGGKTTFLRSIGVAQWMMQCGMFVPAEAFSANVCHGVFTHYKREEDATLQSGKLDEELGRLSDIVDHLRSDSLLLLNESFAATNEREGSEIARQVALALSEKRIKVFFVTHLYDFAHSLFERQLEGALFLRAERQADGTRTFKLVRGEPLATSFGQDLYHRLFVDSTVSGGPVSTSIEPGSGGTW